MDTKTTLFFVSFVPFVFSFSALPNARVSIASDAFGAPVVYVAGLSWLPVIAASAAAKPILECVPSHNGLFVEAPQRQQCEGPLRNRTRQIVVVATFRRTREVRLKPDTTCYTVTPPSQLRFVIVSKVV